MRAAPAGGDAALGGTLPRQSAPVTYVTPVLDCGYHGGESRLVIYKRQLRDKTVHREFYANPPRDAPGGVLSRPHTAGSVARKRPASGLSLGSGGGNGGGFSTGGTFNRRVHRVLFQHKLRAARTGMVKPGDGCPTDSAFPFPMSKADCRAASPGRVRGGSRTLTPHAQRCKSCELRQRVQGGDATAGAAAPAPAPSSTGRPTAAASEFSSHRLHPLVTPEHHAASPPPLPAAADTPTDAAAGPGGRHGSGHTLPAAGASPSLPSPMLPHTLTPLTHTLGSVPNTSLPSQHPPATGSGPATPPPSAGFGVFGMNTSGSAVWTGTKTTVARHPSQLGLVDRERFDSLCARGRLKMVQPGLSATTHDHNTRPAKAADAPGTPAPPQGEDVKRVTSIAFTATPVLSPQAAVRVATPLASPVAAAPLQVLSRATTEDIDEGVAELLEMARDLRHKVSGRGGQDDHHHHHHHHHHDDGGGGGAASTAVTRRASRGANARGGGVRGIPAARQASRGGADRDRDHRGGHAHAGGDDDAGASRAAKARSPTSTAAAAARERDSTAGVGMTIPERLERISRDVSRRIDLAMTGGDPSGPGALGGRSISGTSLPHRHDTSPRPAPMTRREELERAEAARAADIEAASLARLEHARLLKKQVYNERHTAHHRHWLVCVALATRTRKWAAAASAITERNKNLRVRAQALLVLRMRFYPLCVRWETQRRWARKVLSQFVRIYKMRTARKYYQRTADVILQFLRHHKEAGRVKLQISRLKRAVLQIQRTARCFLQRVHAHRELLRRHFDRVEEKMAKFVQKHHEVLDITWLKSEIRKAQVDKNIKPTGGDPGSFDDVAFVQSLGKEYPVLVPDVASIVGMARALVEETEKARNSGRQASGTTSDAKTPDTPLLVPPKVATGGERRKSAISTKQKTRQEAIIERLAIADVLTLSDTRLEAIGKALRLIVRPFTTDEVKRDIIAAMCRVMRAHNMAAVCAWEQQKQEFLRKQRAQIEATFMAPMTTDVVFNVGYPTMMKLLARRQLNRLVARARMTCGLQVPAEYARELEGGQGQGAKKK